MIKASIISKDGTEVQQMQMNGSDFLHSLTLDIDSLETGIYTLRIHQFDQETETIFQVE